MKKTIQTMLWVVLTTLLTSCAKIVQTSNPQEYSKALLGAKPNHHGSAKVLKHGIYNVTVYQRSVRFTSTTGLVRPAQVEVFDLDGDRKFDTVFLLENSIWSFGTTPEFKNRHKVIDSTLSNSVTLEWVRLATALRKPVAPAPRATSQRPVSPPQSRPTSPASPRSTVPRTQPGSNAPTHWKLPFPNQSSPLPPVWQPAY